MHQGSPLEGSKRAEPHFANTSSLRRHTRWRRPRVRRFQTPVSVWLAHITQVQKVVLLPLPSSTYNFATPEAPHHGHHEQLQTDSALADLRCQHPRYYFTALATLSLWGLLTYFLASSHSIRTACLHELLRAHRLPYYRPRSTGFPCIQ